MTMENKRFEEVYKQGKLKIVKVIRDNETGVCFIHVTPRRIWCRFNCHG